MTSFELYLGGKRGDMLIPQADLDSFISEVSEKQIDSFTVIPAMGHWKGQDEPSTIIRVIAPERESEGIIERLRSIGESYKKLFSQESVFMTFSEVQGWFF